MLNKDGIISNLNTNIVVSPLAKVKDNYIEVTLGNELKVYVDEELDLKKTNETKTIIIPSEGYLLEANKLYLGRTNEYTKTDGFVPMLNGLDSIAALGMEIHVTAGFGDNGFKGTWTLEIVCASPTLIYPNMPIGRIYYFPVIGDETIKYQGKYLGQINTTASKIETEYKLERKK